MLRFSPELAFERAAITNHQRMKRLGSVIGAWSFPLGPYSQFSYRTTGALLFRVMRGPQCVVAACVAAAALILVVTSVGIYATHALILF